MQRTYWYLGVGFVAIVGTLFIANVINNYTPKLNVKMAKLENKNNTRENVHIIFNTIPKSASVYVSKILSYGLNSELVQISPGYFPHDHLLYGEMEKFYAHRYVIAKAHLDASMFNQQMLKKFTDRIVVQFRDPREILLSWIHYIQRIHDEGKIEYLYHFAPTPPEEYFSWSLSKQVDWNIDNFLPSTIVWMQEWLVFTGQEAVKENGFKVLLTTYDEFKQNEQEFFRRILSFYNIPREQFKFIPLRLDMEVHFRKGDQNEWREVYSAEQLMRINKLSNSLLEKFNWPKT